MYRRYLPLWALAMLLLCSGWSCRENSRPIPGGNISFYTPINQEVYKLSSEIPVQFVFRDSTQLPDSIILEVNGKRVATMPGSAPKTTWKANQTQTGVVHLSAKAWYTKGVTEQKSIALLLISNTPPRVYTYKVVGSYPHDKKAYTQGLFYEEPGILWESTGQYGLSTLRKVDLTTGKVLQTATLPEEIFGEGMTVIENKIYQLSWKERLAFIYNKENLTLLERKPIRREEGWGLTHHNGQLIMSDGSSYLYFLDPVTLEEKSRMIICDNKQAINYMNEMEMINGELWANIYTTDIIARIDISTGSVTGYIDLAGLLPPGERDVTTDVLNGIAWDSARNRIFVTGKNWPKVFEIEVIEK